MPGRLLAESRQASETAWGLAWASLKTTFLSNAIHRRIWDHKRGNAPHWLYLRRGRVFTVTPRELETSMVIYLIEQIAIGVTEYHWSCPGARESVERPPKVLSSPNFLSFDNKTLGSKTSAKKEIKRNTLFIWHLLFVQQTIASPKWQHINKFSPSNLTGGVG